MEREKKFEIPVIKEVVLEMESIENAGPDNGSSIGWGSCCYNDQ